MLTYKIDKPNLPRKRQSAINTDHLVGMCNLLSHILPGVTKCLLGGLQAHQLYSDNGQSEDQPASPGPTALLNPQTSIILYRRPSYTANINSETPADCNTAVLHCGDVLGTSTGTCCLFPSCFYLKQYSLVLKQITLWCKFAAAALLLKTQIKAIGSTHTACDSHVVRNSTA